MHPDDEYAKAHENGAYGKTECWYILDCDENASIIIGHNAKDTNELKDMIRNKRWSDFIREIPVHKGDFFQIEPGCLHAIKGGTLILETQQNSDITYRVYDYERLQNGKPRHLHIDQSIKVITVPFKNIKIAPAVVQNNGNRREKFVECKYYTVEKIDINIHSIVEQKCNFMNVSVIAGEGTVDNIPVKKGSNFIIPYGYGSAEFIGKMTLIISYI